MKALRILCALLAYAPLAFAVGTPGSTDQGGAAAPAAGSGGAGAPIMTEHSRAGRDGATAGSRSHGPPAPSHGVDQLVRGNADRLHSLLNAQARGRIANAPRRAVSIKHESGNMVVHGQSSAGPLSAPVPKFAARPATSMTAAAGNSRMGASHSAGVARVGGPALGRTAHDAAIAGTQLHHKL